MHIEKPVHARLCFRFPVPNRFLLHREIPLMCRPTARSMTFPRIAKALNS
jgi:hypothetical protein